MSDMGAQHPTLCPHHCWATMLPVHFWAELAAWGQVSAQGLGTGRAAPTPWGPLLSCKCPKLSFPCPSYYFPAH